MPRLARRRLHASPAKAIAIRPGTTYAVSGGLGALGFTTAKWLVNSGASHVALLSRSAPVPERIKQLRAAGDASVEWVECDVGSEEGVVGARRKLEEMGWPPVTGVVHAAGLLADCVLAKLGEEELMRAIRPKVLGALNLRSVFKPTDFLVLFSSVAAVLGAAGQANYAVANALMDAMACSWVRAGERALSIQWGAWSEAGMAAANKSSLRRGEQRGFGSISNQLGLDILNRLFSEGTLGAVMVAPVDWARAGLHLRTPLTGDFSQFASAEGGSEPGDLLAVVRQVAEEVVGSRVADDAVLLEAGMDSLGAVEFRNQLASQLGVQLASGLLFDWPTIASLAGHLKSSMRTGPVPSALAVVSAAPVLVIGAGLGGLSFARSLAKAGETVLIMESKSTVGGVWSKWANSTSKLQIDSPSYDFGCTDLSEATTWPSTYPTREQILSGARRMASIGHSLPWTLLLNTGVDRVRPSISNPAEYVVDYTAADGRPAQVLVSGVAALTGGLHAPRRISLAGEERFAGKVRLGVEDDLAAEDLRAARVVILGHGAFAIENMRTALENGAEKVTILCRRRNLVFSTVCNWLLNSAEGNLPVKTVMSVMRPMYALAGQDVDALACFKFQDSEVSFEQGTVPPASDLYFLAQALGRLEVIEDFAARLEEDVVVTESGRRIRANVLLTCLGFRSDEGLLKRVFGADAALDAAWLNADPNLFAYNDAEQRSGRVSSLLCSSYLFFVQAFASAYVHFRGRPDDLRKTLGQLQRQPGDTQARLMVMLWDFLAPAKRNLAERTRRICPFNLFVREREQEWLAYQERLDHQPFIDFYSLLRPSLDELRLREPHSLFKQLASLGHSSEPATSLIPVYRAQARRRVLFLHGQGTDGAVACNLLERCGWFKQLGEQLEFVVPDAPYEMPAFNDPQQLSEIGLDTLVEQRLYSSKLKYKEWRGDFNWFAQIFHGTGRLELSSDELAVRQQAWTRTLDFIRAVSEQHGPFDGIAGFCEGASVASAALHLQKSGMDLGLASVRFFVGMAPWRNPYFEMLGLYSNEVPLDLPSLHISGQNDMLMFKQALAPFVSDFKSPVVYEHGGKHEYPVVSSSLKKAVLELLHKL